MPIRVVVIDDDADYRWLFRFSLQLEHDITVIGEAEEGEAGVALALQEQPDIVVMDLMMPRINGFEATKRLKRPTRSQSTGCDLTFSGQRDTPGGESQRRRRDSR